MRCPSCLDGARVLLVTAIDDRHRYTGNCRHHKHGELQGPAQRLAICAYDEDMDAGVYLFRCDAQWNVITDTWHQDIRDARKQAAFEYEGINETWRPR